MLFVKDYIQFVRRIPYKTTLEIFRDLKIGGEVIGIVKYTDELVL